MKRAIQQPRSLQGRLLLLVLGGASIIWLAATLATWNDARHELDELLDSHLAQAAALLVVRQGGEFEDDQAIDAPSLHRYAPRVVFQVFHEGKLVLRSAGAPATPLPGSGTRLHSGFETVRIDGESWRVFAAAGAQRDVQVYVGEKTGARSSILWAVLRGMLWPFIAALPLLALAVWWAVRRGTAPLRQLGTAVSTRQASALQPLAIDDAPVEIAPVIRALNELFARISALLESERRFTADAAHELRTPIAAIRAQAQVALGEADQNSRRHALSATIAGCDRASHLVEQLLTLARLEASTAPAMAPLDGCTLIRQVSADLAPRALEKNQDLELVAPAACPITGNSTLLEILARNLIDNAIRYAPAKARIRVTLEETDSGWRLTVADSGAGLSQDEQARLGERFFRVLGNDAAGSGLGWSIVHRIAGAHGLSLSTGRSEELGGLEVSVETRAA